MAALVVRFFKRRLLVFFDFLDFFLRANESDDSDDSEDESSDNDKHDDDDDELLLEVDGSLDLFRLSCLCRAFSRRRMRRAFSSSKSACTCTVFAACSRRSAPFRLNSRSHFLLDFGFSTR